MRTPTVLYVCTANLCRSPVAERLLRSVAGDDADLVVASAGTSAVAGMPVDPPSATALRAVGVDPDGHRSRVLTPELVDGADLVLTATAVHRDRITAATPAAVDRVFTMREFARLAAAAPLDPAVGGGAVAAVAGRRADPATTGVDDDVADPYGRGDAAARAMVAEVLATVRTTARALGLD